MSRGDLRNWQKCHTLHLCGSKKPGCLGSHRSDKLLQRSRGRRRQEEAVRSMTLTTAGDSSLSPTPSLSPSLSLHIMLPSPTSFSLPFCLSSHFLLPSLHLCLQALTPNTCPCCISLSVSLCLALDLNLSLSSPFSSLTLCLLLYRLFSLFTSFSLFRSCFLLFSLILNYPHSFCLSLPNCTSITLLLSLFAPLFTLL